MTVPIIGQTLVQLKDPSVLLGNVPVRTPDDALALYLKYRGPGTVDNKTAADFQTELDQGTPTALHFLVHTDFV
jgi:hypothetical protein